MWRKQPEAKPPSSAPDNYGAPGRTPSPTPISSPAANSAAAPASSAKPFAPASANASVLTRGIRIKGELFGNADLYVDGEVEGSIRLGESNVVVGPSGRVRANIDAREVTTRGKVGGNLRGRERVVLGATSEVKGDVESPRVVIEDGAQFHGRVEMGPAADARERLIKKTSAPAQPAVASQASRPFIERAGAEKPSVEKQTESSSNVETHTAALKP